MRLTLRAKAISVCDDKIAKKGEGVGLSFYAFFANKNDDPTSLWKPPSGGSKPMLSIISRRRLKFVRLLDPGSR